MALTEADPGSRWHVRALSGDDALRGRLTALGLLPGTAFEVVRRQAHGPLVLEIRGSRIAIGRGAARHIAAEPAGEK